MQRNLRTRTVLVLIAAIVPVAACGHKKNENSAAGSIVPPPNTSPINPLPDTAFRAPTTNLDTTVPKSKHHSKAMGAVIGGAAGHAIGHGAAGAAAGAIVQHERNKHNKPKQ